MVTLVEVKAMHIEEVGDFGEITKPVIQEDNLVIHEK